MIVVASGRTASNAALLDQMYRARAVVFHDRLKWDVEVHDGLEIDHYDETMEPLYLIATDENGQAYGSLRILPTTGPNMMRNEFRGMFAEPLEFERPGVWECTRFCIHPQNGSMQEPCVRKTSSELLMGLCFIAMSMGVEQIVAVYFAHMMRVWKRIGWSPTPLAQSIRDGAKLHAGIWDVSRDAMAQVRTRWFKHNPAAADLRIQGYA